VLRVYGAAENRLSRELLGLDLVIKLQVMQFRSR
jgi:hypothetical protein